MHKIITTILTFSLLAASLELAAADQILRGHGTKNNEIFFSPPVKIDWYSLAKKYRAILDKWPTVEEFKSIPGGECQAEISFSCWLYYRKPAPKAVTDTNYWFVSASQLSKVAPKELSGTIQYTLRGKYEDIQAGKGWLSNPVLYGYIVAGKPDRLVANRGFFIYQTDKTIVPTLTKVDTLVTNSNVSSAYRVEQQKGNIYLKKKSEDGSYVDFKSGKPYENDPDTGGQPVHSAILTFNKVDQYLVVDWGAGETCGYSHEIFKIGDNLKSVKWDIGACDP